MSGYVDAAQGIARKVAKWEAQAILLEGVGSAEMVVLNRRVQETARETMQAYQEVTASQQAEIARLNAEMAKQQAELMALRLQLQGQIPGSQQPKSVPAENERKEVDDELGAPPAPVAAASIPAIDAAIWIEGASNANEKIRQGGLSLKEVMDLNLNVLHYVGRAIDIRNYVADEFMDRSLDLLDQAVGRFVEHLNPQNDEDDDKDDAFTFSYAAVHSGRCFASLLTRKSKMNHERAMKASQITEKWLQGVHQFGPKQQLGKEDDIVWRDIPYFAVLEAADEVFRNSMYANLLD